jgi:hypothetical protein
MKFFAALAGAMLLAFCPLDARAESTVKEFLKKYDASNAEERVGLEIIVSRTENGFAWANSYLQGVRKDKPLYCEPNNFLPTGSEIVEMMRREAKTKPEAGSYLLGYGILVSLQKRFPCPPRTN